MWERRHGTPNGGVGRVSTDSDTARYQWSRDQHAEVYSKASSNGNPASLVERDTDGDLIDLVTITPGYITL